jgi:serine/threonine protein kinase
VVDSNYWIKLIDFGSASYIPKREEDYFKRFNGTAHFASPEVAVGFAYRGPEAEIWYVLFLFTF